MKKLEKLINKKLSRKELREIEKEHGIYLDKPANPERSANQQFSVYDEDEKFVGDIVAEEEYFTKIELKKKIKLIFEQ